MNSFVETLTSCADNWGDCDTYLEYCQQQTSDGQTVRENCPLTCGSCPGKLKLFGLVISVIIVLF